MKYWTLPINAYLYSLRLNPLGSHVKVRYRNSSYIVYCSLRTKKSFVYARRKINIKFANEIARRRDTDNLLWCVASFHGECKKSQ